jgi:hypothetical protein
MTLEEFNYIAEILASVAVIASLIYVGLGVRQNAAATQVATGQAYVNTMNEYVGLINTSSNLADVLHRGANGLSNLKESEVIQFGAFLDQSFINFETFYFQWKAGVLDARLWSIYSHAIADFMVQTGQQQWWGTKRHWYDQEFQEYVDHVIAEDDAKPMHPFSVEHSKTT